MTQEGSREERFFASGRVQGMKERLEVKEHSTAAEVVQCTPPANSPQQMSVWIALREDSVAGHSYMLAAIKYALSGGAILL